jgi:hypothetical protein
MELSQKNERKKNSCARFTSNLLAAAYTVDSLPLTLVDIDWGSSAVFVVQLRHRRFGTFWVPMEEGKTKQENEIKIVPEVLGNPHSHEEST